MKISERLTYSEPGRENQDAEKHAALEMRNGETMKSTQLPWCETAQEYIWLHVRSKELETLTDF